MTRPWIGDAAESADARLLARTMGGRDLALGLGTLRALAVDDAEARPWVALAGMADAVDAAVTVLAFRRLPRGTRWGILASTVGAAVVSFRVALALEPASPRTVARPAADPVDRTTRHLARHRRPDPPARGRRGGQPGSMPGWSRRPRPPRRPAPTARSARTATGTGRIRARRSRVRTTPPRRRPTSRCRSRARPSSSSVWPWSSSSAAWRPPPCPAATNPTFTIRHVTLADGTTVAPGAGGRPSCTPSSTTASRRPTSSATSGVPLESAVTGVRQLRPAHRPVRPDGARSPASWPSPRWSRPTAGCSAAAGWKVIYQGPAPQGAAGATEVLATRGSSDGFYWEIGVVVSPTTPTGSTPYSVEVFETPDGN